MPAVREKTALVRARRQATSTALDAARDGARDENEYLREQLAAAEARGVKLGMSYSPRRRRRDATTAIEAFGGIATTTTTEGGGALEGTTTTGVIDDVGVGPGLPGRLSRQGRPARTAIQGNMRRRPVPYDEEDGPAAAPPTSNL